MSSLPVDVLAAATRGDSRANALIVHEADAALPAAPTPLEAYARGVKAMEQSAYRLAIFTRHSKYLPVRYVGPEGKAVDPPPLPPDQRPELNRVSNDGDLATVTTGFSTFGGSIFAIGLLGPLAFGVVAAVGIRCTSLLYKWAVHRAGRRHAQGAPAKVLKKLEAKLDESTPFGKALTAVLAQDWLDGLAKADIRGVALYDRLSAMANNPAVSAADLDSAKRFVTVVGLTMSDAGWARPLDELLAKQVIRAMEGVPAAERPAIGAVLAERLMKKRPKKFDFALWQRLEKALVG